AGLGQRVVVEGGQVEHRQLPGGQVGAAGAGLLLEDDPGAVGGQVGALDPVPQDVDLPGRQVAVDQEGVALRAQRGEEVPAVGRVEGHAPEVVVGRLELLPALPDGEVLEIHELAAGGHVPDRR